LENEGELLMEKRREKNMKRKEKKKSSINVS
jgi:hypothetical protein